MWITVLLALSFAATATLAADEALCLDLMIAIDTSCGIELKYREMEKEYAINLTKHIFDTTEKGKPGGSVRIGVVTWDGPVKEIISLAEGISRNAVVDALTDLNVNVSECDTRTFDMFTHLHSKSFTPEGGDREDAPNAVVQLTCGRTFPPRMVVETVKEAGKVKDESKAVIFTIIVPNRNFDKNPPLPEEVEKVPSPPAADHKSNITDAQIKLLADMRSETDLLCNVQRIEEELCMDLIFAIDTSCSIEQDPNTNLEHLESAGNIVNILIDQSTEPVFGGLVHGMTYNDGPIDFFGPVPADDAPAGLLSLNLSHDKCRTRTYMALNGVADKVENSTIPFSKLLVVYTDGVTYPYRHRPATLEAAKRLHNAGVMVAVVELPNIAGKKDGTAEFNGIASDPSLIFSDPADAEANILSKLSRDDFKCPT